MKKVIIVVCCVLALPMLLFHCGLALGALSSPAPKKPTITYGEFPYRIEYEVDGKTFIIEDVLICEYTGISFSEGNEKIRTWKSYSKNRSSNGDIVLLLKDGRKKVSLHLGGASYYMNEEIFHPSYTKDSVSIIFDEGIGDRQSIELPEDSTHELWEEYKIRIIDWKLADPIKNTFE